MLRLTLTIVLLLVASADAAEYASVGHARKVLTNAKAPLTDRVDAANWLARQRGDAAAGAARTLVQSIDDPLPDVRRAAINGLVQLGTRDAAPALRARLAQERDTEVLPALLLAIGKLGIPADGPTLDPYTRHPSPGVRAAAITALAHLPHDLARVRSLEALTQTDSNDPSWRMRAAALLALARVGEKDDLTPASAAFVEGKGARFWFARSAYARLVANLADDPVATLMGLIRDDDVRVAVTAAEGLARSGHTETLVGLLSHSEAGVRLAAVGGVEQAEIRDAIPRLRFRAQRDVSRRVRWAAARALFRMDDPLGEKLVLLAVSAREPAIWVEAVSMLRERTGADHGRNVANWREALRRERAKR